MSVVEEVMEFADCYMGAAKYAKEKGLVALQSYFIGFADGLRVEARQFEREEEEDESSE